MTPVTWCWCSHPASPSGNTSLHLPPHSAACGHHGAPWLSISQSSSQSQSLAVITHRLSFYTLVLCVFFPPNCLKTSTSCSLQNPGEMGQSRRYTAWSALPERRSPLTAGVHVADSLQPQGSVGHPTTRAEARLPEQRREDSWAWGHTLGLPPLDPGQELQGPWRVHLKSPNFQSRWFRKRLHG